ncbi:unnamed protein product [Sphenostylis stenocarpa]|uniref:Uncharacterized protein n=1 Tax=Sphenostylis stenocarpa TaxID=92480 RepID=A0AA87B728_9FABA|nr:unnamed protein product [Sphenostylis stenocarpa]
MVVIRNAPPHLLWAPHSIDPASVGQSQWGGVDQICFSLYNRKEEGRNRGF